PGTAGLRRAAGQQPRSLVTLVGSFRSPSSGQPDVDVATREGAPMTKVVRTTGQGPGWTGRTLRRAVRLGVLAGAVLVGRKTAGRKKPPPPGGQGGAARAPGLDGAAGDQAPAAHLT